MHPSYWVILAVSLLEVILLAGVIVFFLRLRRSEQILAKLQQNQNEFIKKIDKSADLEKQLLDNFIGRQSELVHLETQLAEREKQLRLLLQQAESVAQSPAFLRQIILTGHRKGKSPDNLAHATGLSVEEVELILEQARR